MTEPKRPKRSRAKPASEAEIPAAASAEHGPEAGEKREAQPAKKRAPRKRAAAKDTPQDAGPHAAASVATEAPGQKGAAAVSTPHAAMNGAAERAAPQSERPASDAVDEDVWSEQLAGETGPLSALIGADVASAAAEQREGEEPAARLRSSSDSRLHEAAAFGSSQSLLSTDYYFRQYGARGMRSLVADVDDFGFDPHVDEKVRPLLEAVCRRYFRVELVGAEHVPVAGSALLVCNRSGALPWDGLVLRTALRTSRPELAGLRWLSEDSVIQYPFMGVFMNRLGAVRACPENAERLIAQKRLVAVFPEGAQGSRKLFRDRYRLQRFGRGGYVKLALRFGVPIIPTAIIGAEETNPVLGRSRLLGRIMGRESVPITPTFPLLGPVGLLPAPVRWRIAIGEPIDLSAYGASAADDALVIHRLNEQIRSSLQALVDQGKIARGGALFG